MSDELDVADEITREWLREKHGVAKRVSDDPVERAAFDQPFDKPQPGAPYRPIDHWIQHGKPPPVTIQAEIHRSILVDGCPKWMKADTYRWLLARLKQLLESEVAGRPVRGRDRVDVWTARHIWEVTTPPTFSSDAGAYDMIGPLLDLAREAKRRGRLPELAVPTRRRLDLR